MTAAHHFAGTAFLAVALALGNAGLAAAHGIEDAPLAATERDRTTPSAVETLTGTVHELFVDDPLRGTSHRYVDLRLDDGTLVPLRGNERPDVHRSSIRHRHYRVVGDCQRAYGSGGLWWSDALAPARAVWLRRRRLRATAGMPSIESSTSAVWTQVVNAPINGTNVALAANGGVASASSVWGPSFAPSGVIDNRRSGAGWGNYAGWADGTSGAFPDWMQIEFAGSRTIDHVVVYSVQDNYLNPVEPTDTMTGTRFVLSSFEVQGWNGSG